MRPPRTVPGGVFLLVVAVLLAVLPGCGTASGEAPRVGVPSTGASSPGGGPAPTTGRLTKLLTVVEENHSLAQMKSGMPYLYVLAQRFGYADHYTGVTHPSLPNYLAIAGGDTFGVQDDQPPSTHALPGQSVFGQALAAGRTAQVYEESMPQPCALDGAGDRGYAVRHNPWAYFVDERAACRTGDVSSGFLSAARADALPDAGMLMPNTCHDAHDTGLGCDLGVADDWLRQKLPTVLGSQDFTSGALAIVLTADEDDKHSGNRVLTVVLHASLDGSGTVVHTPLTHYSLSRLYSQLNHAPALRQAAGAPDLAAAFGLPLA